MYIAIREYQLGTDPQTTPSPTLASRRKAIIRLQLNHRPTIRAAWLR